MAKLPSAFNANDHEKMGDYSAIPAGEYEAKITASESKESNNNPENHYWKLTFEVISGDYKGRKLFKNLNLVNTNPTAVEIANKELSTICEAVGKVAIKDTAELHGIPMKIKVKVTEATAKYPEGNDISYYEGLGGVAKPTFDDDDSDEDSGEDESDDDSSEEAGEPEPKPEPVKEKAKAKAKSTTRKKKPWED